MVMATAATRGGILCAPECTGALCDGGSGVPSQERQGLVVEFCDVLIERRVGAPFEHQEFSVADTALQRIRETHRRELIVASERDLRRRGNSPEMSFDVMSQNSVRLLDEIGH